MSSSQKPVGEPTEIASRYQVVRKLGAGAFGTVYKAKDKILGRMVAIKTIRLEGLAAAGASLEELMDRFKREATVSAMLKHPNIVTIYDIGDADGLSYIAMEFIDGVGLDRIIAEGRLSVERAASIGAQVADALDFAHKDSVVHRDIKPANIMIEAGDRVKVTDFGIAKVTNSGEHLTMTGSLLGTPSYMSPEQARGGELDGRSDLFSVGCVLYEMLAGQKAFRGDSITGLIFKIITEDPPPIREIDPRIPEEAARIVTKALSKAPETRYQSGRELAHDLLALTRAGSAPTLRSAETPTSRGMNPMSSPTIATPPTVASSPTVASAPTRVTPPARTPPPPQRIAVPPPVPQAPTRKHGMGAGVLVVLAVGLLILVGMAGLAGWYFFLRGGPVVTTAEASPPAEAPSSVATAPIATEPAPIESAATPGPATLDATPPPVAATTPRQTADTRALREVAPVTPPRARLPAPEPGVATPPHESPDQSFLDEEPPAVDGSAAGRRLADAYRSGSTASTPFGGGATFRGRPRSPRDLVPAERPAVATLRHVMNAEEAFQSKNGRYGAFGELVRSRALLMDVPVQDRSFVRKGYRFEVSVESDGFTIVATPVAPGTRPFVGDDSGFIRAGVD